MPEFEQFIQERIYLHNVSSRTVDWYRQTLKWLEKFPLTEQGLKASLEFWLAGQPAQLLPAPPYQPEDHRNIARYRQFEIQAGTWPWHTERTEMVCPSSYQPTTLAQKFMRIIG